MCERLKPQYNDPSFLLHPICRHIICTACFANLYYKRTYFCNHIYQDGGICQSPQGPYTDMILEDGRLVDWNAFHNALFVNGQQQHLNHPIAALPSPRQHYPSGFRHYGVAQPGSYHPYAPPNVLQPYYGVTGASPPSNQHPAQAATFVTNSLSPLYWTSSHASGTSNPPQPQNFDASPYKAQPSQ